MAPLQPTPKVSFLICTHNRSDVLLHTLGRLAACGMDPDEYEIIVVDNASRDGTVAAVAAAFPRVRLICLNDNLGACAKNAGLERARGTYIVYLDDDSYPLPGSVPRMLRHFEAQPRLGAAVFTIHLPSGQKESSAYPQVFIGCGTGLRRRALRQVGGLPTDFFMAAEEYDLSLRLLDGGWEIRSFEDLHVMHRKVSAARFPRRITRLDVRNNLIVIARYFPQRWVWPFAIDWLRRYWMIASSKGHRLAFLLGALQATMRWPLVGRRPVGEACFECFAKIQQIRRRLQQAKQQHHLRTVLFVDFGKNMTAYWLAARACGLRIIAIADPTLAVPGRAYRGIRIVTDEAARQLCFDAALLSNLSPAHCEFRRRQWRNMDERPVIDLFEDDRGAQPIFSAAVPSEQESPQTVARSA